MGFGGPLSLDRQPKASRNRIVAGEGHGKKAPSRNEGVPSIGGHSSTARRK